MVRAFFTALLAVAALFLAEFADAAFRTREQLNRMDVGDMCNPVEPTCDESTRFRSLDGTCNNLEKPLLGSRNRPFARFCPAEYADGVGEPFGSPAILFRSHDAGTSRSMGEDEEDRLLSASLGWRRECGGGEPINLPEPRLISTTFSPNASSDSPVATLMHMQFGQLIAHDVTFTPEEATPNPTCCAKPNQDVCLAIPIPLGDPFISANGLDCIERTRSLPFCDYPVREQFSQVTAFIDGSVIYDQDEESAMRLVDPETGLLLNHVTESGVELLPKIRMVDIGGEQTAVFTAGDPRVLENIALSTVHVLFLREHNRVATEIRKLAPALAPKLVYEHTRRIVVAEMQNIVYDQYLKALLGPFTLYSSGLAVTNQMSTYKPRADPTIRNEFATAAFRFGHSMIQGKIQRRNPDDNTLIDEPLCLRDNFFRQGNVSDVGDGAPNDEIIAGMIRQPSRNFDRFFSEDVTKFLRSGFNDPPSDLMARNTLRGRDHGFPGYNHYRKICGLPEACSWSKPPREISLEQWEILSGLYNHPSDIDLFVAGLAERPFAGGLVGKTFNCLMKKQFRDLKFGDRFFFSHYGESGSFTQEQFDQLRYRRLSDLICENTDVQFATVDAFKVGSRRLRCNGRRVNRLDISAFQPFE